MRELTNIVKTIEKIKDFFIEFEFSGITSVRFYNTLYFHAINGTAQRYVLNYFKLIDSPYVEDVRQKLSSKEFKQLMEEYKQIDSEAEFINSRLKIYFGNQGGGKTSTAIEEFSNAKVIICNSSFEPNDLFENFTFTNGKPTYTKSFLWTAMENGETVILDEMNLLTRDCLRCLQGILDGKDSVAYKDKIINIKQGFQIIGTMNLEINGEIEELPAPLVDRAYDLVEFIPTSEFIAQAIFKN